MKQRLQKRIGYRTIKTVLASLAALILCDLFPAMDPVLTVMGVYCAMERTIADSWLGCLNQFFGVVIGSVFGFLLLQIVPSPPGWLIALLLLPVIVACNVLRMSYAVFLSSIIFLSVAAGSTSAADIFSRIRDVSIGLAIGLTVNLTVHPNSNEPRIHSLIRKQQTALLAAVSEAVLTERYPELKTAETLFHKMSFELEVLQKQLFLFHRAEHAQRAAFEAGLVQLAERMYHEAEAICTMDALPAPDAENLAHLREKGIETELRERKASSARDELVLNYHLSAFLQASDYLDTLMQSGS